MKTTVKSPVHHHGGVKMEIDPKILKELGIYQTKSYRKVDDSSLYGSFDSVKNLFYSLTFSYLYVTIDNKKRFVLFLLGCSTIVLVCLIMALLQNTIRKADYIFLRISEDQTGENDILFIPRFSNTSTNPLVNVTFLEERLKDNPFVQNVVPRWMLQGSLRRRDDTGDFEEKVIVIMTDTEKEVDVKFGRNWPYRILGEMECHVKDEVLTNLGVRANRGDRVVLSLDLSSLLGGFSGDSYMMEEGIETDSSSESNEVEVDRETLLDILDLLGFNTTQTEEFFTNFNFTLKLDETTRSMDLEVELIAIDAIKSNYGKYPSMFTNLVILDSRFLEKIFEEILGGMISFDMLFQILFGGGLNLNSNEANSTSSIDWNEFSFMGVTMYPHRFDTYTLPVNEKKAKLIKLTDSLVSDIGINESISVELPMAGGLVMMDMISLFLEQIFVGMVTCLSALGTILIFSLLLSNVEEKTYEYAMLRSMGLQELTLILITFIQAFYFAIPGIMIAFIIAYVINIPLEVIFHETLNLPFYDWNFSWDSVLVPAVLGLFIPFISSFIPVRVALGKSLRNSLDVTRTSHTETKVSFQKLENLGLEPWQFVCSCMAILFGFIVYYIMPLTFIFDKMNLFMYVLEFIFIGMLSGLCILALVFQAFVERVILWIILVGNILMPKDRRLYSLIKKNMAGHRKRSRKTFLMFTLTIAFVIFSGVNLRQLVSTFAGSMALITGSHVGVMSTSVNNNLRTNEIDEFLFDQKMIGNLSAYGFHTFAASAHPYVSRTRFSTLALYPRERISVYGIDQDFLSAAFTNFYIPSETNKGVTFPGKVDGKNDLFDILYDDEQELFVRGVSLNAKPKTVFSGRKVNVSDDQFGLFDPMYAYESPIRIVVGEAMRDYFGMDSNSPILISVLLEGEGFYYKKLGHPVGMLKKCPGFFISSFPMAAHHGIGLMSIPQFSELLKEAATKLNSSNSKYRFKGVSYEYLILKFPGANKKKHRRQFMNRLKVRLNMDFVQIFDVEDLLFVMRGAVIGFTALQYTAGALALILCTYMLALSFIANVRDNSFEFGVLRAIGFRAESLIRAFIYEAIILVSSSFFCGTLIGVVIGSSLIAQFNLFLEMPFQFEFPYDLVFGMLGMSVALAIVGSYLPAREIKKQQIANILKGII